MQKSNHEWSKEALFAKAQLYAAAMRDHEDSHWQFGIWSALTLEMLVRSVIANVSPALLADSQDWNNILYGLGGQPKRPKFVPKSAAITDLVGRLEDLCPGFNREHANFCASHFARRNSEIHTGHLPFESLGSSAWLPTFYTVCGILTSAISESLDTLFGTEAAKRAREDIAALEDDTAKAVKGTIAAHKTVWEQKSDDEKAVSKSQVDAAMLRHYGHRTTCPACGCVALMQGKAAGAAKLEVDEDGIWERQIMKPEALNCVACGLKIAGYSKLLAAELGDTFVSTTHYDAMEYFDIDLDAHARSMMEEDYNE